MQEIEINGRKIGAGHTPYIVAEMSCNHGGDLNKALKMIKTAASCGADAVKIQTMGLMTIDAPQEDFQIRTGPWAGRSLAQLYREAHTPKAWHAALFEQAKECGITLFSTPYADEDVDFLETFDCPAYKISSYEITDLMLIKKAASTGKPIILSTGMATTAEISEAVRAAKSAGCKQLAILHCVSAYPAPREKSNLETMVDIGRRFDVVTGLSDHSKGFIVACAAVSMGAGIIEKHFKLDDSCLDKDFSIEPSELFVLKSETEIMASTRGQVKYGCSEAEKQSLQFRRSLYFVKDIKEGEVITADHVKRIRPGYGLHPRYYSVVIGAKAGKDMKAGDRVKLEDLT